MIAHCKAIGKIKRSNGEYKVSDKYKGKYKAKKSGSKKSAKKKSAKKRSLRKRSAKKHH